VITAVTEEAMVHNHAFLIVVQQRPAVEVVVILLHQVGKQIFERRPAANSEHLRARQACLHAPAASIA
jgi:type IV secretory pathway VirB3-like protein